MEESVAKMEKSIFRNANSSLTKEDIKMMEPLKLAYIGDACYELMIRTFLLDRDLSVNNLHKRTIKYVKAGAQANIVRNLEEILNDEEKDIVRKGRNAKANTSPKNADLIDYKYATGLEALFGYLYLKGEDTRLKEIFDFIIGN